MARPVRGTEPLDHKVSFRCTEAERRILTKLAGNGGDGTLLRRLIMREWREQRAERKPTP